MKLIETYKHKLTPADRLAVRLHYKNVGYLLCYGDKAIALAQTLYNIDMRQWGRIPYETA